ncbi:S8 family serine peptidase [Croceitalea marina]|uniref:S8 family serine peptidase n=1 Tax=Croceitalea marina TaxID=1775166 RepID=A0ABW5MRZ1_9FLAO
MKSSLFFILFVSSFFLNAQKGETNLMDSISYWQFDQFGKDSFSGISSDLSSVVLSKNENDKVIIALIDSDIDVNHHYLNKYIWANTKEVKSNNLDDDKNGYIDDIHGWNFLAKGDKKIIKYANNTSIRFTRAFKQKYERLSKKKGKLNSKELDFLATYNKALNTIKEEKMRLAPYEEYIEWYETSQIASDSLLLTYDFKKPYNLSSLDSLFNEVYTKGNDEERGRLIYFSLDKLKNNREEDYKLSLDYLNKNKYYALNENLTENHSSINNTFPKLGSNRLDINISNEKHGTQIGGVIVKTYKAITENLPDEAENIEIMPISIFPENGAEFEEDIAKAIRYAVNNGADIINYSSSIRFLLKPSLLYEALLYAEKHNVLIVTSAGNTGENLDKIMTHPRKKYKKYRLSNLIMVGMSDSTIGPNLKPIHGNYGKETVDLFAPGTDFLTTNPKNEYFKTSGSSISSAIVATTCATIKLYHPKLKAAEIREIILQSVSKYNGEIFLDEGGKTKVLFTDLCMAGGILNVENAFKLAVKK